MQETHSFLLQVDRASERFGQYRERLASVILTIPGRRDHVRQLKLTLLSSSGHKWNQVEELSRAQVVRPTAEEPE